MTKPLQSLAILASLAFNGLAVTVSAHAATEVLNVPQLRQRLGLAGPVPAERATKTVKVAILDNGFAGYAAGRGLLPESAELVPPALDLPSPSAHGLGMAQVLWAVTGKSEQGPKIYLLNTNGFTNFKAAIDFVVRERVDVVLYSQVWTFGSGFEGTGFINAQVSRALDSGAIWINAAGNFGGSVYQGKILAEKRGDFLRPRDRDGLRFVNRIDDNEVELTLSWTDFKDDENYTTMLDLDLLIYDERGKLVGSSELIQQGEAPSENDSKLSSHARERIRLRGLDRGTYTAKVRVQSDGFEADDRYRLVVDGIRPGSVDFIDRTPGQEVFPPADHPGVLTVGERSPLSSQGPTLDGRAKPDVLVRDAIVQFSNGLTSGGSSTAAAMVAGAVVILKAAHPTLTADSLLNYTRTLGNLPSSLAGLRELRPDEVARVNPWVTRLVPVDGRLLIHANGHLVIVSPTDPFSLAWPTSIGARRTRPGDSIALLPGTPRWIAVSPAEQAFVPSAFVEIRGSAAGAGEWRMPTASELPR